MLLIDTNGAWHRNSKGKYVPEDIDPALCTHILFAYAVLDPENLIIRPSNPLTDIEKESLYKRVTAYRKNGVKVMAAIGGLSDTVGAKYDRLLSDENNNRKFIASVMAFVENNNFDGLDLEVSSTAPAIQSSMQHYFIDSFLFIPSNSIRFLGKMTTI